MSYPPYCITNQHTHYNTLSKIPLQWNIDFSTEDYGYEIDGIVSIYTCPHENCNAHYKIITLHPSDNEIIKFINYSHSYTEDINPNNKNDMISHCIYCANELVILNQTLNAEIKVPIYDKFTGTKTLLKCSNCNTKYEVIDSSSLEDSLYNARNIFIKPELYN